MTFLFCLRFVLFFSFAYFFCLPFSYLNIFRIPFWSISNVLSVSISITMLVITLISCHTCITYNNLVVPTCYQFQYRNLTSFYVHLCFFVYNVTVFNFFLHKERNTSDRVIIFASNIRYNYKNRRERKTIYSSFCSFSSLLLVL